MKCMEKTIQASLRNVDVSTRFSSEQFLVVLLNADTEDVTLITNRIFDNFYKVYHKNAVNVSYDIANLSKDE